MIPFICTTCGEFDLDTADCASCAQSARDHGTAGSAVA
uniref:Uncharacterized protein n=1 Tax=Mycolicibacterium neoaurum VKM Ac-1815D TaxID=700508 RepID=V5XHH0_MYCNE